MYIRIRVSVCTCVYIKKLTNIPICLSVCLSIFCLPYKVLRPCSQYMGTPFQAEARSCLGLLGEVVQEEGLGFRVEVPTASTLQPMARQNEPTPPDLKLENPVTKP